ncbi:unnamed protein product [Cladocopium goreaui]|uniref:Uncharacterized protein n=1 Tax=Cladocopium goreaui TaxID=2562237 RepID=A0A9P1CXQ8_9DINO|nr:unnamed protein product [Cladocopium goreaui]
MADDGASDGASTVLDKLCAYLETVASRKNLGDHLNEVFQDRTKMKGALDAYVTSLPDQDHGRRNVLSAVPATSLSEFWLPLEFFDYSEKSKNGYFPNNSQLCMYFREFAQFGYKSSAEAVVTKFPYCDGSRCLEQFSVGVSDGFTKVLLMFLIISFVEELELSKEEQETLKNTLCSFKYVRCTYEHFDNPGHHYLNSLKLGYLTSEKQAPSPISMFADIQAAIQMEQRITKSKASMRDLLNKTCASYNKMTSIKKHRIDGARKSLLYNLLRSPKDFLDLVHRHYDSYPHQQSGLPLEILAQEFWVPGSTVRAECPQYLGKELFSEILRVTDETACLYAFRDFERRASPEASLKVKKSSQLSDEQHYLLFDIVCLWLWLLPKLVKNYPSDIVQKHHELFHKGLLDKDLGSVMKAGEEFDYQRIAFVLEIRGEHIDQYVSEHQDRARDAHAKSLQAAFAAWQEDLAADQSKFEADRILTLGVNSCNKTCGSMG